MLETTPRTLIALIQKRRDFGNRTFITRPNSESAHRFKQRMEKCYPYLEWEVNYITGEYIDIE